MIDFEPKDKCHCDDLNPYEIQCLYHENQLEIAYQEEINKNPIDFKMDIEQVFEPDDCTMVMEDYGKCQDYPCDDCVKRFKKFNELNNIDIKEWNDAFYNIRTKINTSLHLKSIYFLRKYFINKLINFIKRGKK